MKVPPGLGNVNVIAAGSERTMGLKCNGTVVGWGRNRFGQTDVPACLNGAGVWLPGSNPSSANVFLTQAVDVTKAGPAFTTDYDHEFRHSRSGPGDHQFTRYHL